MTLIPQHSGTTAFRSISTIVGKWIHRAAKIASRNPIEMIAGILIASSFSYFYLFNLARTSDIFSGTTTRLYPTFAYSENGKSFQHVERHHDQLGDPVSIQLKQILITDSQKNILEPKTLDSVLRFEHAIEHTSIDEIVGQFDYNSLCYQQDNKCIFGQSLSQVFSEEKPNLSQHKALFGDLKIEESTTAGSILLSYAFNASTAYRQQLASLWEQRVSSLTSDELVSLTHSGSQDDVITWLFIITRNIVLRIKELIEVNKQYKTPKITIITMTTIIITNIC
jgi:hydroxymethylglutaryl-CoA reductase (NADPH)